ncbi:MAG: diaminopimelate decarboxylase [Thermoplasmata archaeon]
MKFYASFDNNDGRLFCQNVDLVDLALKNGTPLLVTCEKRLKENFDKINKNFKKLYSKFKVNYAVKANSNPAILSIFRKLGSGVDTASLGEIYISKYSGYSLNDIIFTPNFASKESLKFVNDMGIKINFDDIGQFMYVAGDNPNFVSFIINPGIGGGEFPGIVTGGHETKFGLPAENALKAYKIAKKYGIKRFGIHMHGGSNNLDEQYFNNISKRFFKIAKEIMDELNIEFEYVDIGGGFGVPYRENEKTLNMENVAMNIVENFKDIIKKEDIELMVEPGRYLVADSTVLLGRVTYIKEYGKKIIGTDIGMNILIRPALYGAYHRIVVANNLNSENSWDVDIVGQICENTDKIAEKRKFPPVKVDDIIAVFNAGAYVYSMSSNYNGFLRPMEILIDEDSGINIIRERENYWDLISHVPLNKYIF